MSPFFIYSFLIMAAEATEYIVSPAPGDEFGVSVAGEDVQIVEDTVIPYWQFLLWLAAMHILSVIDILLCLTKFIFAILGFKIAGNANSVGTLKRKRIFSLIETNPGIGTIKIANDMGLNRGTLRYHLKTLEAENLVEAYSDRGKFRYFQNNSTYGEKEKRVISALQNEMTRKIISKILKEECNTNGDLARTTGISKGAITWYMKQLKESDLIEENQMGKSTIYSINPVYRDTIEKEVHEVF
ncbi:MAG: winged helix-turn-helix transcriptional regulator [Methanosarcina barkeri]|nr:winged helix-turn-helix transcriptional regulator [Methanosarcina sp. ERenArc_MAG2]